MFDSSIYLNQNLQYSQVQQDYRDVKKHVDKVNDTDKGVFYALESLPPVRRLASLSEKIQNGDYTPAVGLASLAIINFPEDMRDIKSSYKQLFEKGYKPKYDYKNYQHDFSFFRGTLLNDFVDPNKTKNPELAEKILKQDKTLLETKFGQKVMKFLNVHAVEGITTPIENIGHSEDTPRYVKALKFKGNGKFAGFGELTARAMTRTTKIGVLALTVLEMPKIFKSLNQGNSVTEQAQNGITQIAKSGINVASITAGIAYGGALGAKKFGATGSIVGMGLGAISGAFASSKIQNLAN